MLLLIVGGLAHVTAAQYSRGTIEYEGSMFHYMVRPEKGRPMLRIDLAQADSTSQETVYEAPLLTSGAIAKGQVFKVAIFRASKERGRWTSDPKSYLETIYDFKQQTASHKAHGLFANFGTENPTTTVEDEVNESTIDRDKAVQYAVAYLIVNYQRVLTISGQSIESAEEEITAPTKATKAPGALTINSQSLILPYKHKFGLEGKTYQFALTELPRNRYDLTIKVFESGEDEGNMKLLHNTYLVVRDNLADKGRYTVSIYLSLKNGYAWQPYPSSYLECAFVPAKATALYRPVSKMREYALPSTPAKEAMRAPKADISRAEMINMAVRHFISYYPKLRLN